MAPLVFDLHAVSASYGDFPALRNVTLSVRVGERVALVGPSGAGKSTLIKLLNGTLIPTSGSLHALGQDLTALSPRQVREIQRQIGTIYQQFHLVDNLRVVHNVNAGQLGRWSSPKALLSLFWPLEVEAAAKALHQVGIPEKLYERADQLSGGQQQRVAIARVLVQDPQAILADEPIASLDPERGREVLDLLLRLSRDGGKTLVCSLHAIELALDRFDRIVGLREGQVLFDCLAENVQAEMIEALYRIET